MFFEPLPSPTRLINQKKLEKNRSKKRLMEISDSSSEDNEDYIKKLLENFPINPYLQATFKDKLLRKEEFKKQKQIIGLLEAFLHKNNSYVKQCALGSDQGKNKKEKIIGRFEGHNEKKK